MHLATSCKSSRATYIDVHGIESVADYLPRHHALRRFSKVPSVYVGHRFTMESTNCLEQVARFLLDGTTLSPTLQLTIRQRRRKRADNCVDNRYKNLLKRQRHVSMRDKVYAGHQLAVLAT